MPETEAMLTIAPFPCRTICGRTCLQVKNMLFRFTSLTLWNGTAGSAFYATRSSPKPDPDRAAEAIQTVGVLYLPTLVSCTPASRPSPALHQSALCAKLQT